MVGYYYGLHTISNYDMKNPCNNDLVMSTQSAASFAAFYQEMSEKYNPTILKESMDEKGCVLHLGFLSDDTFPLERFHELTRRLDDPSLKIKVVSMCTTTRRPPDLYEYSERIWVWQEEKGRTTIAVPDDLRCMPA